MVVKRPSRQCSWTNGSLIHSPGPFAAAEHGIIGAGHELRAIKRYLATRTDGVPWLSNPGAKPSSRARTINYIVRLAGEKAKLDRVCPICSGTHAAFTLRTRAPICEPCKTTLATVIPSTRPTTHALPGIDSTVFGDRGRLYKHFLWRPD